MSWIQAVVLAAAVTTFVSFGWAIARFFSKPEAKKAGMTAISLIGNVGALAQFAAIALLPPPPLAQQAAGIALYGAALAVFWWAVQTNRRKPLTLAFSEDQPEHLVTEGPYAYVRHPFYTAYSLAWLAGPVATGAWWLLAFAAVMFGLYGAAAKREEAKFERSALAEAYRAYQRRTGMFVPMLTGGREWNSSNSG